NFIVLNYKIIKQCTSSKSYEVEILDTTEIKFDFPNNFNLCENVDKYVLQALPNGGKWEGDNIIDNQIFVNGLNKNYLNFKYIFLNQNGCISTSNGQIKIDKVPKFEIQSSRDSICFGDVLSLLAYSEDSFKGYWFTDGLGRIDDPNIVDSRYYPSRDDVNIGFINFSYTIQTENSCGNISKSLKVFVKDGPHGEIFYSSNNSQCEPSLLTINSTFKNIDKQQWFINDSLIDDFDYAFPAKILLKSGDYTIKTIVRDGACQVSSFSDKFTVLPTPSLKFFSNPNEKLSIEMPRLYLKDQSYCKYGHEVKWLLDDSLISKEREFSILLDKPSGTFNLKLIATSFKGACSDSIQKTYHILSIQQLFIPD
ncbi:MAG: hypothetical protein WD512_08225, partial [Candidatus Paceibacterota bacterium]